MSETRKLAAILVSDIVGYSSRVMKERRAGNSLLRLDYRAPKRRRTRIGGDLRHMPATEIRDEQNRPVKGDVGRMG